MKNIYKVNEEAVKKIAERVYDNGSTVINRNDLEELFPELKESEDERIRKGIICGMYALKDQHKTCFASIPIDNVIAWLEKKGEQKLVLDKESSFVDNDVRLSLELYRDGNGFGIWLSDDFGGSGIDATGNTPEEAANSIAAYIADYFYKRDDIINMVTEKPADKIEPKFHEGDKIYCKLDDRTFVIKEVDLENGVYRYTENGCGNDIDYADELFELVEQKPAWSEEDEDILNTIINHFKVDIECTDEDDIVRWLKFLKDRVQPKQEWSDEDKKMLVYALDMIEWYSVIDKSKSRQVSDWLKSLKERYIWKPSDEQMKALKEAVDEHFDIDGGALWHLYEDLKKLKD